MTTTSKASAGRFSRFRERLRPFLPPVRELVASPLPILWGMVTCLLLGLCHPPYSAPALGLVALVPWLWGLRDMSPRMAFWVSWITATIHFFSIYSWIGIIRVYAGNAAIYLGVLVLAMYMGFFMALVGWGHALARRRLNGTMALIVSALWLGGMEWFRSVGQLGVPYGLMGHTVRDWTALAQLTSIGGVTLVSALLMAVNVAITDLVADIAARRHALRSFATAVVMAGVVVMAHAWGNVVVAGILSAPARQLRVALVQPDVEQKRKMASYSGDVDPVIRARLQGEMATALFRQLDSIPTGRVDLVVTPESAFTSESFDEDPKVQARLEAEATRLGAAIITGANDNAFRAPDGSPTEFSWASADALAGRPYISDYSMYGGLWIYRPGETGFKPAADYRKYRLMPFGETVPYFDLIPGFQRYVVGIASFARGTREPKPIPVGPRLTLGPTICYEDLFPDIHAWFARQGVDFYVNITNDGWYEPTTGPAFHFEYARLRCAEARRPMLRCTNRGITAVIDATGRVQASLPRRREAILTTVMNLPAKPTLTPYMRFGDWFGVLGLLGGAMALGWAIRKPGSDGVGTRG